MGIAGFVIVVLLQLTVTGFIIIKPSSRILLGGYGIQFTRIFRISPSGFLILFLLGFVLSYLGILSYIRDLGEDTINVIGDQALLTKVNEYFFDGQRPNSIEAYHTEEILDAIKKQLERRDLPRNESNINFALMQLDVGYIVTELLEKYNFQTVKHVMLTKTPIPNAFTFRLIPIPKFGSDWIVVHSNLMEIMDFEEIRAIIAHELAHIKNKDSWLHSILYSPAVIVHISWLVLYFQMILLIFSGQLTIFLVLARIITIIIFNLIINYLSKIVGEITAYSSRRMELLADYEAANMESPELIANALIKLGQRSEVIGVIEKETRWVLSKLETLNPTQLVLDALHYIGPDEMSEEIARSKALEYTVSQILQNTFQGLQLNRYYDMRNKLVNSSIENLRKEREKDDEKKLANLDISENEIENYLKNWRDADLNQNEYLERGELIQLVQDLRENHQKIFRTDVLEEFNVYKENQTHPNISDRINFLYDNHLKQLDTVNYPALK